MIEEVPNNQLINCASCNAVIVYKFSDSNKHASMSWLKLSSSLRGTALAFVILRGKRKDTVIMKINYTMEFSSSDVKAGDTSLSSKLVTGSPWLLPRSNARY